MRVYIRIFIAAVIPLLLLGCSTKKDAFLNRTWHAFNTKYNVRFNGEMAYQQGRKELDENYYDDFWETLPVERMQLSEVIKLDSEDNNPNFERAEVKATKAIQRRSMDIQDEERNSQMDETFLLLGKARYFEQRFVPALESFNYILKKHPTSNIYNTARIWREKTNMRLDNPEVAIKNLRNLLKYENLKSQELADANATLAESFLMLGIKDTALQHLKVAQAFTKNNPERGRYLFIMGQLYDALGHKDSANLAYNKVIKLNRKSPRVYMVNAHLKKIQNLAINENTYQDILDYLTDLEEDRENRPYLDKIYRQLALFHLETGKDSISISYFNKSLKANPEDKKLASLNYENLATYNFDLNQYKLAGAYYDSVLQNLPEKSRKFRSIKKKFDNLEDVIAYEDVAQQNDSIITLFEMPEADRIAYFEGFIASLKAADEAKQKAKEQQASAGFAAFAESTGGKKNQGKFYFYNIASLGYGKTDFKTRWGDRALEDDWRWSNKSRIQISEATGEVVVSGATNQVSTSNEKYEVAFYLDKLPTDEKVIDSLIKERDFANYQLGLIYKEKFKELPLAAEKLETVLKAQPEERLVLPSKYNLYKIYEALSSPLAAAVKTDILNHHSTSRYAEILRNPEAVLAQSEDSPQALYNTVFKLFENQEFVQVITQTEELINTFVGEPIVPKLEMLKAHAIGKVQGFEAFKEALNFVALNYPNNPEGKKAADMVANELPGLAETSFIDEEVNFNRGNWKVVFPFTYEDNENAEALKKKLEEALSTLRYKNKVSRDVYNLNKQFVVVHDFKGKDYAQGFVELIQTNKDFKIMNPNFVVLSNNYKVVLIHKNLEEYQKKFLNP